MPIHRTPVVLRAATGALALVWTFALALAASGADGTSFSVITTASVTGSTVSGVLTLSNEETGAITFSALTASIEVRFDEGVPIPALPAGSDVGWYRIAVVSLAAPATLPAGGSQGFPFVIDPCATAVAGYRSAKDMRAVGVASAGRVRSDYSDTFPLPAPCPVCGNSVREGAEQCDAGPNGGGCCSSACTFRANGTTCSDGNACTQADGCQAGVCVGGAPIVCTASDQCRVAGTCNPATGACSQPAKPNGSACNDQNACTQTDSCQAGSCRGSNPIVCPASGPCLTGTCDPSTGACSNAAKPDGTACTDSDACTNGDRCVAGACVAGEPLVCNDQMSCTTDSCNPATGCGFAPAPSCEACDATQCTDCSARCETANVDCQTGCWAGFSGCLAGCTSTYCAPFCQVDLGRCLESCPTIAACQGACETGNGCGSGCSGVAASGSSTPAVPSFSRIGLLTLAALLAIVGGGVAVGPRRSGSRRDP